MKTKVKKRVTKSIAFTSTTRAIFEHEQAANAVRVFSPGSVHLVTREGNIVTVPDWYPISTN